MTKSAELEKVLNKRRAEIANEIHADLMVRLHCDAGEGSGYQVFVPTHTGTVNGVTGPSKEVIEASQKLGKIFHQGMIKSFGKKFPSKGLASDDKTAVGSKQGALTGSIFSKVPVLLVEMVVLTSTKDEDFIASDAGKNSMVEALEAGVLAAVKN